MKNKLKVGLFSVLVILLIVITLPSKADAATWVIDNDAAAGQPGSSGITGGSWSYRGGGMFNDHRINYGNGSYAWNTHGIGNSGRMNAYAYINNRDFVGMGNYYFVVNGSSMGVSKIINQNTAPGGYNYIGTINNVSARTNYHIMLNNAGGGAIGADAVQFTQ
ncbi:hypothetical protein [Carnobacterium maltaromaticum]|jgi:hypothetical protein|uniref:Uncharacterized protein n=1 Tax=Carnobacterium maltaromaticum LMA28 TaxID=1234679 RepID=K8ESF5_CARML|nr:hypothetical protein [Carnobacterium maltaromaticum]AOA02324.1 hypothetical protein BFC23_07345 [Carnobacterium maltaromaticum]KRN60020.1 hypothetical protein IV70_GL001156 [Carnobacterium maltaromaticum DSM 20342]MCI1820270.1 hypothetical protein [Carnobacterium maltaromaticum]CCO11501.2 hypothetical protein BN424_2060 [Carnobacterium maltaromaticum LMA28]